jgi:hypothetical protein
MLLRVVSVCRQTEYYALPPSRNRFSLHLDDVRLADNLQVDDPIRQERQHEQEAAIPDSREAASPLEDREEGFCDGLHGRLSAVNAGRISWFAGQLPLCQVFNEFTGAKSFVRGRTEGIEFFRR